MCLFHWDTCCAGTLSSWHSISLFQCTFTLSALFYATFEFFSVYLSFPGINARKQSTLCLSQCLPRLPDKKKWPQTHLLSKKFCYSLSPKWQKEYKTFLYHLYSLSLVQQSTIIHKIMTASLSGSCVIYIQGAPRLHEWKPRIKLLASILQVGLQIVRGPKAHIAWCRGICCMLPQKMFKN